MAGVLVASTVLVDHLRGHEPATAWLAGLEAVPLCSEVSRVEILTGMRSGERRKVEALFSSLDWVPVAEEVARRAGVLGRRYRSSHRLGAADLIIAASVEERGAQLATGNVRHFPMFPDLTPPY